MNDWNITGSLENTDPEVASLIKSEAQRQRSVVRLIPSENYVSKAVQQACDSAFGNKYSEGYAHRWRKGELVNENGRYYQGQEFVNRLEPIAQRRALELFVPGKEAEYHANVQPLSGSPANFAVLNALLQPGETFLGLALSAGGHLTHGHSVSVTSRFFRSVQFSTNDQDLLDYDQIREMARQEKPKLIICGSTSYPRKIDYAVLGEIAREANAYLVADIAHISGIVATGLHPDAFPHADIVTMTTHKMLRGPRGGIIICRRELGEAIDRSVFPGLQGGPHENTIAGIAVALGEALRPTYREYTAQIIKNAAVLAAELIKRGFALVTGGTDNHLMVIDTKKGRADVAVGSGTWLAETLEAAGIVANKNSVKADAKPWLPTGLRLGVPAVTTIGFIESDMIRLAEWIERVAASKSDTAVLQKVKAEVQERMKTANLPL